MIHNFATLPTFRRHPAGGTRRYSTYLTIRPSFTTMWLLAQGVDVRLVRNHDDRLAYSSSAREATRDLTYGGFGIELDF